eukprot:TRINITY_DN15611_c0_g1_i1.p1 TRINITY_DN15611_c0_g1~~TRINITY_DN15611_c0_g1_i1.p1  ORF type:complete len:241 (-),score=45.74 TRINITY_DN15611_c0_g1_i1:108-830(-)
MCIRDRLEKLREVLCPIAVSLMCIVGISKMFEKAKRITNNLTDKLKSAIGKPSSIKRSIMAKVFSEVIENDPLFTEILQLLKNYYDCIEKIAKESEDVKRSNKMLNEQVTALKSSLYELTATNDSLRASIKNIEEENFRLKEELKELNEKLKESKERETVLNLLLSKDNEAVRSEDRLQVKRMRKCREVGKNKVKIPELDLSAIHKSEDEHNSNDSLKKESFENAFSEVAKSEISQPSQD